MKIDGREIAKTIQESHKKTVVNLNRRNIYPHVAVIFVGNDSSSAAYIQQKKRYGESIGIHVSLHRFPKTVTPKELLLYVALQNTDKTSHGIIIQRPMPIVIARETLNTMVIPSKDVDGFHPRTKFIPPVAMGVFKILEEINDVNSRSTRWQSRAESGDMTSPMGEEYSKEFVHWLKNQKILIIGRGESGGGPIAQTLEKMHIPCTVAHSKTENMKTLCRDCDIIISCVGKPNIVRREMVSNRTILLGVGLHTESGKLKPDYTEEDIKDVVKCYTPVPGGVGPVNVACLFENVLIAASKKCIRIRPK